MINNIFIFIVSLVMVVHGATMATKHAVSLAKLARLSKYTIGLIVVAVISILPETFISVNAALRGESAMGLGLLLGSNIADLTLIFALLVFTAGRSLKIESKIIKNHVVYPFVLLLPIILGMNGNFSRLEGLALIIFGVVFYYTALRGDSENIPIKKSTFKDKAKNIFYLLLSMAMLLVGSHFTVTSAVDMAEFLNITPVLIGMLVVSLGTTLPEFIFSLKAVKQKNDSLAVGDVLGTVLADATIVVGILALIRPFSFPQQMVYVTGIFMVLSSIMLFYFMKSGRYLTKREAFLLFCFWVLFVLIEVSISI